MACACSKGRNASAYIVKLPGQAEQTVKSEQAAQALTTGVRGATYRAIK